MGNEVSANFELFNNAADNNKQFIADELKRLLVPGARVLEIGSGSGQHAVHVVNQLEDVSWQPADKEPYFGALERNLGRVSLSGIEKPVYLDVAQFDIAGRFDAVFCANVMHIMSADLIPSMMAGVGSLLESGGLFILYGPYKYEGAFTTQSNENFDGWLRSRDPLSGIRDIEVVQIQAKTHQLELIEDNPMPANNQLLVFRKSSEN
jgi:cyclopropane fatty-acyl-phospholipid synthase-like methyltransferase